MVATVDDPELGPATQIGVPIHLLGTPGAITGPQPLAGAAQRRDLRRARLLGATDDRRDPRAVRLMHALEGVRLIDFGQYLAGPFGPMILGDLGADVIKVEPVTGDGMRMAAKPFFGCQRGKRDIALDLKDPAASRSRCGSSRRADVVHHNMTAGVARRLGIGYDDCKRREARHRLLQHVGVRPRRIRSRTSAVSTRCTRRRPGSSTRPGAVRDGNTPLYYRFGMCDTVERDAVGRRRARRARTTGDATGEGQELWTSLHRRRRGVRVRRDGASERDRDHQTEARRRPAWLRSRLPPLRDERRLDSSRRDPSRRLARSSALRSASMPPRSAPSPSRTSRPRSGRRAR